MHNSGHISILSFHGDPNVGLHGFATDKYCLVGSCATDQQVAELEARLKVPVFKIKLYGTDLIGLFAVGNSSVLLLPDIIFENELQNIKQIMEKINIKVITIKTEHTAFGNNISMNDKVAIVSDAYSKKSFETLKEALHGLKVEQHSLAKTTVPGSIGKITNIGAIFSTNLSETEINSVEKLLGFEIGIGTVNLGNPFVASGIIANSFGFAIGSMSSGFEMGRVDESLRLLK